MGLTAVWNEFRPLHRIYVNFVKETYHGTDH